MNEKQKTIVDALQEQINKKKREIEYLSSQIDELISE